MAVGCSAHPAPVELRSYRQKYPQKTIRTRLELLIYQIFHHCPKNTIYIASNEKPPQYMVVEMHTRGDSIPQSQSAQQALLALQPAACFD